MTAPFRPRRELERACQRDLEAAVITRPDIRAAMDAVHILGRLSRILRNVQADMESIARQAAGSDDLSLTHWHILVHLLKEPTCKQVDLRSRMGIAPPHLTKLLDDLAARSFVRRDKCPRDRRQFMLTLTRAGRDACISLLSSWTDIENTRRCGKIALILNGEWGEPGEQEELSARCRMHGQIGSAS